jgi:hypothetical protein
MPLFQYKYMRKTKLLENSNFCLFAANGNWETANFRLFSPIKRKMKVRFPWTAIENGKRHLLCQYTCHLCLSVTALKR